MRVADFTAFWAGPMAAQILAGLGAEVIHIEGPRRPDGIRMNTLRTADRRRVVGVVAAVLRCQHEQARHSPSTCRRPTVIRSRCDCWRPAT